MRRQRPFLGLLFCLLSAVFLSGCGGGEDLPTLYQMKGTVTHNGKPLTGIILVFTPLSGGRPSYGNVDENGKFSMAFTNDAAGVAAGQNIVTLMQPNPNPDTPPLTPEMRALFDKYGEGKSSLNVTVDGDKNDFELKLD
ncbi:hypothetical protein [uncultured Gimesia sp.]|uniref:hypothetical protein n=1 Tax=uncultured Gimesia sp. TaxID=1678688 RepID=UPI0030D6D3C0|tara:strand:- start:42408 stop:42824 length:417 start_codon:yes stop_codon:yes gene_type:complete